jgi:hypothetical protein
MNKKTDNLKKIIIYELKKELTESVLDDAGKNAYINNHKLIHNAIVKKADSLIRFCSELQEWFTKSLNQKLINIDWKTESIDELSIFQWKALVAKLKNEIIDNMWKIPDFNHPDFLERCKYFINKEYNIKLQQIKETKPEFNSNSIQESVEENNEIRHILKGVRFARKKIYDNKEEYRIELLEYSHFFLAMPSSAMRNKAMRELKRMYNKMSTMFGKLMEFVNNNGELTLASGVTLLEIKKIIAFFAGKHYKKDLEKLENLRELLRKI